MASPFRVFRKHQKAMIAALILMAMFSFILVPSIMQIMRYGRSAENPVVVTSRYGNIEERQLQNLRLRRQQVLNFLQRVQLAVVEAKRQANLTASEEEQVSETAQVVQEFARMIGPATEEDVVDTWLYVRHAEQLGMIVSTKAINDFIRELTEDRLNTDQVKKIIKDVNSTQRQFFDVLRQELLAIRVRMMFNVSSAATTPAQRWEYYTRLKRLASIEAIPVPVADYVDKIKEPSEKVLREFFEAHKDNYPNPYSPDPGFRTPHRIAVRYFKADVEKFMAVVSEEEVKEFYQENKEGFDRLAPKPDEEPATGEKGAAEEGSGEKPSAERNPEAEKQKEAAEEPTAVKEGAIENKEPAEKPASEDQKEGPKGEPSPETVPAEGTDKVPAEDKADGPAIGPKPGDTSSARAASPFRLTSFPAEAPASGSQEPTPDTSQKSAPDEKKEAEDLLTGAIGETIRRQLAGRKIEEIFGRLQGRMNRYRNDWVRYEVSRMKDPAAAKPEEPDFEALAKADDPTGEEALITGQTSLMSQWDLRNEPSGIGQSFVYLAARGMSFAEYAFRERWDLYLAAKSSQVGEDYLERTRYLFWKVEDGKEGVPKFEDRGVRQRVLAAWKSVEARKLAIQAAEDLGDEARKTGMSLSQTFMERPDIPVTSTRPFSWLTHGNVPLGSARTPPRLSEVRGVEMAGPDFMRTVFRLEKAQIGVTMNHPQTIAYVVRVSEINPPQDALWAQFEVDSYGTYADVAVDDRGQMFRAWRDELKKAADLEWVRPPHRGQGE